MKNGFIWGIISVILLSNENDNLLEENLIFGKVECVEVVVASNNNSEILWTDGSGKITCLCVIGFLCFLIYIYF